MGPAERREFFESQSRDFDRLAYALAEVEVPGDLAAAGFQIETFVPIGRDYFVLAGAT